MHRYTGITLLELLLAIGIIAVLALVVVPGFTGLVADMRVTAQVNRFVHGIHLARQQANQSGFETTLCKSPDGRQCDSGQQWSNGWLVFINQDQDRPPIVDAGERILHVQHGFTLGSTAANRDAFAMRPFGKRSTNGTVVFCAGRRELKSRTVIISYTGKPRVSNRSTSGTALQCPGPV